MAGIITAKNLTKSYGGRMAVDHIDLDVAAGEFYGFLGPNGAGKTTTIRMLTGIIAPDEGSIAVGEHPSRDKAATASFIGVVPEGRGFYEWMTGAEYLGFFADLYGMSIAERNKRVKELLEKVGLSNRGNSRVGTYSRGMKQRLALARALVHHPRILFLDEPTLGLDPQGQEDIQRLLKDLNKEGITIFLSSHLLNEVSNLCLRIVILHGGRIVANGTLDELRTKTKLPNGSLTDIFLQLTRPL
ncbi:MAG: ABC transporter ATP-binding protein [Patescibacteria group bacterium]|nr:ABC transporter ATP-binding protein [Patescibacteria group bacterium]